MGDKRQVGRLYIVTNVNKKKVARMGEYRLSILPFQHHLKGCRDLGRPNKDGKIKRTFKIKC